MSRTNQKKILSQKLTAEKDLQELKEYTRKLEQKIVMGAKGQCLGEINTQLQSKVQELKQEKQQQTSKIFELEGEIELLKTEIKTLSSVCYLKAEEFGFTGNNSNEILCALASSTQELQQYKDFFNDLQAKYKLVLDKSEELQIIRESNNEELNRLEEENLKLKNEVNELMKSNKDMNLDRNALLQCLEEMSAQEKQYEMDIEYFNKQLELHQQQAQDKIQELLKEIELKDLIIKEKNENKAEIQQKIKDNQEIEGLKTKLKNFIEYEKENALLKNNLKNSLLEIQELKKDFESKEKRLKNKLAMCFKELETLLNEKEEIQNALNNAVSKCSMKITTEDRPRQHDDTLSLLNQAKQKNIDLLKSIS